MKHKGALIIYLIIGLVISIPFAIANNDTIGIFVCRILSVELAELIGWYVVYKNK